MARSPTGFSARFNSSSGVARFHTSLAAVVWLLSISMAHADSSSQDLIKAIKTWDVGALQAQATQASDIGRQGLPRGVLKAFAGEDDAAIDLLKELIASRQLDGELRFAAFDELGTLYLRNQHYLQAAGAFESALGLYGNVTNEETDRARRCAVCCRRNPALCGPRVPQRPLLCAARRGGQHPARRGNDGQG